ncbi:hypothetical protein [Blastococcus sp. LR1]|uniref:hypothetical protein n=1 Tax=Blastococcus sp. LR1 TaxID=2877000 RepID=UPI001CCBE4B9|nr:hypothetical protein [Blastococcus sp. LR1]MCA0146248.1 hypothetical protein [Blastococcus sp. LR1]
MDVLAAGSAAELVLGTVLGVLLAVAAGAAFLRARRPGPPRAPEPTTPPRVDDLADFLEHPPGTRPGEPTAQGWVSLAAPPPPPEPAPAPAPSVDSRPLVVLCLLALALVGVAAAVAVGSRDPEPPVEAARPSASEPASDPAPPPEGTTGRLTAGGLVLEQRAVGITVAYPELTLTTDGSGSRLELRLPTWNCLAARAPEDPEAAGCAPSLVEHAELESPELVVERDGDGLLLRGPAATEVRPAGSAPEPTGRVYDLELNLLSADGTAVGEVRMGAGTAPVSGELGED